MIKFYNDRDKYQFKFLKEMLNIYNKKMIDIVDELKKKYNFEEDDYIELVCILRN
jgi:hypothetical protein